jgi:AcrR family transcriptional regulator
MTQPVTVISRRDRKKELTRREIYEAAMRLFAAKSFGEVTISEICETADVGRGTFFLHFPTKAALLYEFNERVTEDFRAALGVPRASARAELQALVERMGIELAAQAEIMTAMLADFFTSPETIAVAPKRGVALAELVTEIIARGQASGEFDASLDPRLAAAAFLSTAIAFLSGKVIRGFDVSHEEISRQFLRLTFRGLDATE